MKRIKKLYELYKEFILRYFLRMTGNLEEAGELTQETFYQACLSIHRFRQQSSAKTWLYAIARNVYLNNLRKKGKDKSIPWGDKVLPSEKTLVNEDPSELIVLQEKKERITKALTLLPEKGRTVLILKEYEQLGYEEIAEIFDQSVNWVRVTFFRAKNQLYQVYKDLEGDDEL